MSYHDIRFDNREADTFRQKNMDRQQDCGLFDGIIGSKAAPGFRNNNLLYSDDAFFHAADKVVSMRDQSGLSSSHIMYQTLTAKERILFAEAFQHRFSTLSTFPVPGEKPEEEMMRRVNNLFGSILLAVQVDDSLNIRDQENIPGRSNEPRERYIHHAIDEQQRHQARKQPPMHAHQSNFPYYEMGAQKNDGTGRYRQYSKSPVEAAYQEEMQQRQPYQPPSPQHNYQNADPRAAPNISGGPRLPQYQHRHEERQDAIGRRNHNYDQNIARAASSIDRERHRGRSQSNVTSSPRSPDEWKNERRREKPVHSADRIRSRKSRRSPERYGGYSERRNDRSPSTSPERDGRRSRETYHKSRRNLSRSPDQKKNRSQIDQQDKTVTKSSPYRRSNKYDETDVRYKSSPTKSEASADKVDLSTREIANQDQRKLAAHEALFLTKAQTVQSESKMRQSLMTEIDHAREMIHTTTDPAEKETFWKHLKVLQLELLKLSSTTSLDLNKDTIHMPSTSQEKLQMGKNSATSQLHDIDDTAADNIQGSGFSRELTSGVENKGSMIQHEQKRDNITSIDRIRNAEVTPVTMDTGRSEAGSMYSAQRSVPTVHSEQTLQVRSSHAIRNQADKSFLSQNDHSQSKMARNNDQQLKNSQMTLVRNDVKVAGSTHHGERLVSVMAPNTLPEGYRFEAKVGSEVFLATVPKGGVVKGQVFQSTMTDVFSREFAEMKIPEGRWRDDIFDCLKYGITHPFAVISCLFPQIALSQIMARMRLTSDGRNAVSLNSRIRVKSVLGLTIGIIMLNALLGYILLLSPQLEVGMFVLGLVLLQTPLLYCFYHMLIKTRKAVRRTYKIPEGGFEGFEDMIVSIWCTCCALTQMGRHTADYNTYRALWCTDTGLPDHLEVNLPADSPQVHLPSII